LKILSPNSTLLKHSTSCSDAFFQEERNLLEEKRQKIRLIQQRKVSEKELTDLKDLPQEIPLTLSIGHRVYSHITHPEEGVFLGTIAAVDLCEHTYRVVFDRPSIGSQTVYDYEIKSVTPIQTIPIKVYIQTFRPKMTPNSSAAVAAATSSSAFAASGLLLGSQSQANFNLQSLLLNTPYKFPLSSSSRMLTPISSNTLLDDLNSLNATNPAFAAALMLQSASQDPMLGLAGASSPYKMSSEIFYDQASARFHTPITISAATAGGSSSLTPVNALSGLMGGFPIHLLLMITRLSKILNVKKDFIRKLNQMNTEAERLKANRKPFSSEFQVSYASLVLDLEKLNKDLSEYLSGVEAFWQEYATATSTESKTKSRVKNEPNDADDTLPSSSAVAVNGAANKTTATNNGQEHYVNESIELINKLNKIKFSSPAETTDRNESTTEENNERMKSEEEDSTAAAPLNLLLKNPRLKSKNSVDLIVKLTSLLLQVKDIIKSNNKFLSKDEKDSVPADSNSSSCSNSSSSSSSSNGDLVSNRRLNSNSNVKALNETLNEIKSGLLSASNAQLFEDKVQVHMNHIESVLYHYSKLHAFNYEIDNDE
jgi:hypothetical protein